MELIKTIIDKVLGICKVLVETYNIDNDSISFFCDNLTNVYLRVIHNSTYSDFQIKDTTDIDDMLSYIIATIGANTSEERKEVKEALSPEAMQADAAIMSAIQVEKEAVLTYETLLTLDIEEDTRDLFDSIVEDKKGHISLLTALQSAKTSNYVDEEDKAELDSYAEGIIGG